MTCHIMNTLISKMNLIFLNFLTQSVLLKSTLLLPFHILRKNGNIFWKEDLAEWPEKTILWFAVSQLDSVKHKDWYILAWIGTRCNIESLQSHSMFFFEFCFTDKYIKYILKWIGLKIGDYGFLYVFVSRSKSICARATYNISFERPFHEIFRQVLYVSVLQILFDLQIKT